MTRCPFSLSRLVNVSNTGKVIYQSEKQACRAFPESEKVFIRAVTDLAVCIRFAKRAASAVDDMGRFGVCINPNARSGVFV